MMAEPFCTLKSSYIGIWAWGQRVIAVGTHLAVTLAMERKNEGRAASGLDSYWVTCYVATFVEGQLGSHLDGLWRG